MQSGSSSSSSFFEGGQQQQNTILLLAVAVKQIRIIFEMRKRNLSEMRENCSQNQKKVFFLDFFSFLLGRRPSRVPCPRSTAPPSPIDGPTCRNRPKSITLLGGPHSAEAVGAIGELELRAYGSAGLRSSWSEKRQKELEEKERQRETLDLPIREKERIF